MTSDANPPAQPPLTGVESFIRTGSALETEFAALAEAWQNERGPSSSMTKFVMHPAYQRIIGMGPPALPLILRELQRKPDYWFWALRSITGEEAIRPEHAGNLQEMTQDWLQWAKSKGFSGVVSDRAPLPKAG